MTAYIESKRTGTSIHFGKSSRKRQGYVALVKPIENGDRWEATDYQFLESKVAAASATDSLSQAFEHCQRMRADIPQDYTGLVMSESAIFEADPEIWFYWFEDGLVQHDAESIPELVDLGCIERMPCL